MTNLSTIRLLDELRRADVRLSIGADDNLKVSAPSGFSPELLAKLRDHKEEILESLRRARSIDSGISLPIHGSGRADGEVLTAMQQSLWLTCQLDPGTMAYNMLHTFDIKGAFSSVLFHACLKQIYRRHGALRTRFVSNDGTPLQVVDAETELDFAVVPMSENSISAALADEAARVFDLEKGPLFIARIFQISDQHHVFIFNAHHIVFDGWSCGVLLRELGDLYNSQGAAALPAMPFDYLDFSHWSQQFQGEAYRSKSQQFWRHQLEGAPSTLDFPTDFPRPARVGSAGGSVPILIPLELAQSARALCQQQGITLQQLLMSVFQVLLSRYSGQKDLVIGVPAANRAYVEAESLVGYFVNPLPIRQTINAQRPFAELLTRNKQLMIEVMSHQSYAFQKIVEDHNPERSLSYSPIFQHMFSFQSETDVKLDILGAEATFLPFRDISAKYDLLFAIQEGRGGLGGSIQFNISLFAAESAARWAENFVTLLASVCKDSMQQVGSLSLLHADEHAFVWKSLDHCAIPFDSNFYRIHEIFEGMAQTRADAVALRCGTHVLSYAQLDGRANAIAAYMQSSGVGSGDLVGLCLPRTPDLVAGMIAIFKLGAVYVPLDPKYPALRLQEIVQDSGMNFVLCDRSSSGLVANEGMKELHVEEAPIIAPKPLLSANAANELSHVIYTSGSTGRPKGVMVTHRSVLAMLDWVRETYRDDELAAVLCSTSVCFDISVFEIWAPLSFGGSIVLVQNAAELCSNHVHGLSLINTVPSALRLLVEEEAIAHSVKVINVAGEALDKQLVNELFELRPDVILYNLYGPTEDTTYSTYCRLSGKIIGDPPIGTPINHSYARILDNHGEMVPVGVVGELYLGGNGLSVGYLNRPDLTNERFKRRINDGVEVVEYRTGDLVKLGNDGQLYYVGRCDNQIKLRGFRIELGEVEHRLRLVVGVTDACVVVKRQRNVEMLVAFVAREKASEDATLIISLEQQLRAQLPDYMVPSAFIVMDHLPLNNSGKIDRRALLEYTPETVEQADPVEIGSETEQTIAGIWKSLLQIEHIGIHDDFFKLGGNSLLAMQMVSRLNKVFSSKLAVGAVFECKTVGSLARRLNEHDNQEVLPLERVDTSEGVEASYQQQGAWHIANLERFESFYNMVNAMWLEGVLDIAALQRSLDSLVDRHESLRATFKHRDGVTWMQVAERLSLPLQIKKLEVIDGDDIRIQAEAEIEIECERVFDLINGPLVRASLLQQSETRHLFILTIHHLASDGWSNNLIKEELQILYSNEVGETKPTALPPTIRYSDFAYWQKRWHETESYRKQIDYWRDKLKDIVVDGVFPTDTGAALYTTGTMQYVDIEISSDGGTNVMNFANKLGVTPYVVFMTALHLALAGYSGINQQMVYSPVACRSRHELETAVGLYVNMIMLVSDISNSATVADFMQQISRNVSDAHANSGVSMMALMQKLNVALPVLPSVVLNVIDFPNNNGWKFSGLAVTTIDPRRDGKPCVTGLDMNINIVDGLIVACLGYNEALFNEISGRRIAALFCEALDTITGSPNTQLEKLFAQWR